jgi:hypothetical protein
MLLMLYMGGVKRGDSYAVSLEELLGVTLGDGFDAPESLHGLVVGAHLGHLEILQVLLVVLLGERFQRVDVGGHVIVAIGR